MIGFRWGTATDVGKVRSTNQDQLLTATPVFAVADGMGGHNGGEVAAAIAVDEMAKIEGLADVDELIEAVQQANREIVDRSKLEPELRGMGTTLVALVGITGGPLRLGVANVGDSRLYRVADDGLAQITEDHTLVEALVRDGRLSPEEAQHHPQRNIVTRALGIDERVLVDTWELVPVVGDRYLLCSDGLFNEVDPTTIHDVLTDTDDPAEAAGALVALAVDNGGRDNVTVVVVDLVDEPDGDESHTDDETGADGEGERVIDVPADRILSVHKAVPDRVLEREAPGPSGPSDPHPDEIHVDRTLQKPPFVTWRLGVFVAAVLVVLAVLLGSLVAYARSSYFVGLDGEQVVIYRGRPDGVLWFDPTVEEPVAISVAELDPADLEDVSDGVEFDSIDEARRYGADLAQRAVTDDEP